MSKKKGDDRKRSAVPPLSIANAATKDIDIELLQAVEKPSLSRVKLALSMKADVQCVDECGNTPLLKAARDNRLKIVQLLLSAKANVEASNPLRATPLHLAAEGGFVQMCALLLEYHASLSAKDFYGDTPMDYALEESQLDSVYFFRLLGRAKQRLALGNVLTGRNDRRFLKHSNADSGDGNPNDNRSSGGSRPCNAVRRAHERDHRPKVQDPKFVANTRSKPQAINQRFNWGRGAFSWVFIPDISNLILDYATGTFNPRLLRLAAQLRLSDLELQCQTKDRIPKR